MDLNSASIEPLIHEWIDGLQEAVRREEHLVRANDEFYMPFFATPNQVISCIFKIANHLGLSAATKYIAIHLYDKFMCNHFWEIYKVSKNSENFERSWEKICKGISRHAKLYLSSCLQLASKMDSHNSSLGTADVLNLLNVISDNTGYSLNEVVRSEFKVFKTVGFKMPLYTPFHCLEILLAATGLKETPNMPDTCSSLLDLAYLQREELYLHLQSLISAQVSGAELEKKSVMALECNALFLAASVVLCGNFFLCAEDDSSREIAERLNSLINIDSNDIWDMANLILMLAIQE